MHIIIFGDSDAHGATDWQHGGWVARLKSDIEHASDFDTLVYNLSVSGETSSGLRSRIAFELRPRRGSVGKDLVLIAIGCNDTICKNPRKPKPRISLSVYKKNLTTMIAIAKKARAQVAVIGVTPVHDKKVQPVSWDRNVHYVTSVLKEYNEAAKEICRAHGVPFLDLFTEWEGVEYTKWLDDGLHPNAAGHARIFDLVWEFFGKHQFGKDSA